MREQEQSRCHRAWKGSSILPETSRFGRGMTRNDARALHRDHHFFHMCRASPWRRQSVSATFVLCPGILPRTRPHLTVLEAVGLCCFLQADLPRDRWFRLKKQLGSGMAPGPSAEGRLTCLSVRCLSSYLIFSASFSDQQATVRFAGARLG